MELWEEGAGHATLLALKVEKGNRESRNEGSLCGRKTKGTRGRFSLRARASRTPRARDTLILAQ